ncbi:MAG: hypothetical protein ACC683_06095 [Acidimicrobiia bacterium]
MGDEATKQSLTTMGTTIARYLRDVDPVVDVIARHNTAFRLELDYTSAMRDIGYWLVAKWCTMAGHPEWCDELFDEDDWPLYDDTTEPLADWFDTKLEGATSSTGL